MLKPWRVLKSSTSFADQWLTVRSDTCQTDSGRTIEPYHIVEYPPWVNVVALTAEKEIVLVRQYRHGSGTIMTELPCGIVDESDSSPALAASRELAEETGYEGNPPRLIGSYYANPGTQNNRVSSFLILNARQAGQQALDPNEEIEVVLVDLWKFLKSVMSGELRLQGMHNSALLLSLPCLLYELCNNDPAAREDLLAEIFSKPPVEPS